jgi:hypothetical protein
MDKIYVAYSPHEWLSVKRLEESLKRVSPRFTFSHAQRYACAGQVVEEMTHNAIQDADVFIYCASSAFLSSERGGLASIEERAAIERFRSDPSFRVVNVVLDQAAQLPPQFHSFPVVDLTRLDTWEEDVHSLLRLLRVHQEEREVEGPEPIERTLFLDSQPIAVAYLSRQGTECTMAWPLNVETRLESVLDSYLLEFLPRYSSIPVEQTLEFWIGGEYHTESIGHEPTSSLILDRITSAKSKADDWPELVQISSDNVAMESVFDEDTENPFRLALLLSEVHSEPLTQFFSKFHRNDEVRINPDIASRAFAPESPDAKSLLHPLPIGRRYRHG